MTKLETFLRTELIKRGFDENLESPKGTMAFAELPATPAELGNLLDTMVSRREKVFKSADIVGEAAARASYEDVVAAIEAIKSVIARLSLV